MSELGPIIRALTRPGGRQDEAFAFELLSSHVARTLNAAFLILLQGPSHPAYAAANDHLEAAKRDPDWGEAARFYVEGAALVAKEIAEARRGDPGLARRLDRLSGWVAEPRNLADRRTTAEEFWAVFFPEAAGIEADRPGRLEALRCRRRISVTCPNPSPLADPARELLFTSNVLLTVPPAGADLDALPLGEDTKRTLREALREPQLFWYDHPIPVGVRPENNEILHGLGGLEEAFRPSCWPSSASRRTGSSSSCRPSYVRPSFHFKDGDTYQRYMSPVPPPPRSPTRCLSTLRRARLRG